VTSTGAAWSKQEEQKLGKLVSAHGDADWKLIAIKLGNGRSAAACQARWITKVAPNVTRGNWSPAEDKALLELYTDPEFNSWSKRAIELGRRFHKGVRRGGGETCKRYMDLMAKVAASVKASRK
jgi:hypothetical protein